MKKLLFIVLSILLVVSCEKSDDHLNRGDKHVYLPNMLQGEGLAITLTFDERSRIVRLSEVANNGQFARLYTFDYDVDKVLSVEAIYFSIVDEGGYNYTENYNFVYNQNQIAVEKRFLDSSGFSQVTNDVINVDSEGKLISAQNLEINYDERGNMIRVVDHGNVSEIAYDLNKGAFLNVNIQPWVLYYVMKLGNFYRINNPIQIKTLKTDMDSQEIINRSFEYNDAGFPIRYIESSSEDEETGVYFIDYLQLYNDN